VVGFPRKKGKVMKTLAIAMCLMFAACTFHTSKGACVGLATEDQKKPGVTYKVSWWNVVIGVLLVETVIVPAVVLIDNLQCPE
jgi:hypothetical protein